MRKTTLTAALLLGASLPALAGHEFEGSTTLKDLQPYGVRDKEHKHTAFDLSFAAESKNYTCRTDPKKSVNPVDFVVGSSISYKINGQKVKLKTPENKEVECRVVRVEEAQLPPTH